MLNRLSHLQGTKLTLFNLVTGIVNVLLTFSVGFFLSPFIVSKLGAEANGFTQLASNFVVYATLITTAFNSMAGRFVSVCFHRGEIDKAKDYYSSVYAMNIFLGALLFPISAYVVWDINNLIVIETATIWDVQLLFACIFLNFFLGLLTSLYSMALFVRNSIFYMNLLGLLRTMANAVLLLVIFSVLPIHLFYVSLVSLFLAVCLLPVYISLQRRLLPGFHIEFRRFRFKVVGEMLSAGIWNTINQCGHMFMTGMDLLLANLFINPAVMGVVAVSKTIPSAIIQLAHTINGNFSPSVTIKFAKGNREEMLRELRMSVKISSILVSIPIVTFCCFSYPFYRLWMPTLDAHTLSVLSFLGLLPFIPFAGTQNLYNVFTATNKLKVNSVSFVLTGLLNVLTVYFLLKGHIGNAVYILVGFSSFLAILRMMVVILPYTAKIISMPWYVFYKDVAHTLLCCIVNALISYTIIVSIDIHSWPVLIFCTLVVAVLSFFAEMWILLTPHERKRAFQLIRIKKADNHG